MDSKEEASLLQAIAVSSANSPLLLPLITPQSRSSAFTTLEQFKSFPGRVPLAIHLLQSERHVSTIDGVHTVDVTVPTKMYVLGILQTFLKKEYSKLENEGDRLAIRGAIMTVARQLLAQGVAQQQHPSSTDGSADVTNGAAGIGFGAEEMRILAVKMATLISDVAIRDFPQRWTTFVADIFHTPEEGGLWWTQPYETPFDSGGAGGGGGNNGGSFRYGPTIGNKIALECFSRIVEDCTDGDFNAKVSTQRRNDVLIGLNEVHYQFLPLIFDFLSQQYSMVSAAKNTLTDMCNYLISSGRTLDQMTAEEKGLYDQQIRKRDGAARLVSDCLTTIERCCQSMPTNWMLGTRDTGCTDANNTNTNNTTVNSPTGTTNPTPPPTHDFVTALLHLLREDTLQLQVQAVSCLQYLFLRKLEPDPWIKLVSALSVAVTEAHNTSSNQDNLDAAARGLSTPDVTSRLVRSLSFHRGLSKLLSVVPSAHLAYISTDAELCSSRGDKFRVIGEHLRLMAEMLDHPSPRVAGEQTAAWIALLRDPVIIKGVGGSEGSTTTILQPFLEKILSTFLERRVRVRWDDVLDQTFTNAQIYDESWGDEEEYEHWIQDFRSRVSQVFKLVGGIDPALASRVLYNKASALFESYGSGEGGVGRDCLDEKTGMLTQQSRAVMEMEGLSQPLDTVLQGVPPWALDDTKQTDPSYMEPVRVDIRGRVRSCLKEVANMIVTWNPTDTWLKFRRAMLLDALKFYWRYDQTTLPTGVDALLTYLGAEAPSEGGQPAPTGLESIIPTYLPDDIVGLRKKSGMALISVSKKVPHLLVPWLDQLSQRAKTLFTSQSLSPTNKMHLIEFLSCVATAVQDPVGRSNFVSNVLSENLQVIESPETKKALASPEGFLAFIGVTQVGANPASATDKEFVAQTTSGYVKLFSAFNHLLSVGKRCHQAAKKRPNAGIPLPDATLFEENTQLQNVADGNEGMTQLNFPDEGTVSLKDLELNDPFVPLWPRILPSLIRVFDVLFTLWHPRYQAPLLKNPIQRYVYAISDDDAYLIKNQGSQSAGGVFGEGGTAGSVVRGWDRRGNNLAPKWSYWLTEMRNTCTQLLGLLTSQRALYSPELAGLYPEFVGVIASSVHLQAMEHRQISQYIKQWIEYVLLSCPSTLYQSHLAPILKPFFQHAQYRLQCTWAPLQEASNVSTKPLSTNECDAASELAIRGGDEWIVSYYARGGLFVGDLELVTAETAVEKVRVELSRCFCDMIQSALALKGDWALVLATQAKEEQAQKRNDPSRLLTGPSTKPKQNSGIVNADGTPRSQFHLAIESRKTLRIRELCRFLLLGDESIAGFLSLAIFQCLSYPDAYTCRRCTKICHRILETVAWTEHYTNLLVQNLFVNAVRAVVSEPKWMVGLEMEMISLIRNIYCRLVLGQNLLAGGQGPAMQQPRDPITNRFEQSKTVDKPLLGGGILCIGSDIPRRVLSDLPGITSEMILNLDNNLSQKRAAKDQKDALCDLMRIAAENLKESESDSSAHLGALGRATASESLLNPQKIDTVLALPEKLVTHSMMVKQEEGKKIPAMPSLGSTFNFS